MNRRPDWQNRYVYYPSIAKPIIGMSNGATASIGLVHALYRDLRLPPTTPASPPAFAPRADRRAWHRLDAAAHRRPCQRARFADVGAPGVERRGATDRGCQPAVPAGPVARKQISYGAISPICSPSAIAVIRAALRRAVPTFAEATIDAIRQIMWRSAAAISARASRASWRSGRRGLRGSMGRVESSRYRLRRRGLAGHHASSFRLLRWLRHA